MSELQQFLLAEKDREWQQLNTRLGDAERKASEMEGMVISLLAVLPISCDEFGIIWVDLFSIV
jgi:hypothetical protein